MHRPGILRTVAASLVAAWLVPVAPAVAADNSAVDPNATHFGIQLTVNAIYNLHDFAPN
jgi:hypothetical protein